ncbi:STYKc [Musa troglodytarum]|uniref:non-specific serine/threonine protein kinase n=1 Tax=Musa troglodytarum TaxID=320322 RepID=A0A9E7EK50_9LILI|nr:STYKc [Musa troglodytarum]
MGRETTPLTATPTWQLSITPFPSPYLSSGGGEPMSTGAAEAQPFVLPHETMGEWERNPVIERSRTTSLQSSVSTVAIVDGIRLKVEWNRRDRISSSGCGRSARQFTLEELEEATKNFSESNLVGTGSFGLVYKGLLLDGTIVAIKRRVSVPRQKFVEEVEILSEIRHRNLVTLIGYCQEGGLQMLVFEYLPNGGVSHHLYEGEQLSHSRLEFKQRLAIAIGAAKGLAHLHSLAPPLVHKDFKTNNVLVDENFIAKVADAGLHKLVEAHAGSNDIIDRRLGNGFTSEGMKELIALTLRCLNPSGHNRPKMRAIAVELDQILETEMALTTIMGDGTAIVTLGSQLFTST